MARKAVDHGGHLQLLRNSATALTKAHQEYGAPTNNPLAIEFHQLRMQAVIFNYDICRALVSLWITEPTDLALQVALKDVIHRLYEYDAALSGRLVRRIVELATARQLTVDSAAVLAERKKWKAEFKKLRSWSKLRNETSGHYGTDIARQVALLEMIDRKEVIAVAKAFLTYNNFVCKLLQKGGRGR